MAKGGPSKYTLRSAELQESEDASPGPRQLIDSASENSQSFGPQDTFFELMQQFLDSQRQQKEDERIRWQEQQEQLTVRRGEKAFTTRKGRRQKAVTASTG